MQSPSASYRAAAALVLAGALAACQPVTSGVPPPVPVPVTPSRTGAMISIHAHAFFFPEEDLVGEFMPLDQAIQVLSQDVGAAADWRRRRAVAKLAAYWLHKFPLPVVLQRVEDLAGLQARSKVEEYAAEVGLATLPLPHIIELRLLRDLYFLTPTCRWEAKRIPVGMNDDGIDDEAPTFGWTIHVLFPRALPTLARSMDPQSWSDCSKLFRASYLADGPACPPPTPASCPGGQDDWSGDPPMTYPRKPRGSPYASRAFFEEFCYDQETDCGHCTENNRGCNSSFRNLMCTSTSYTPDIQDSDDLPQATAYQVYYNLRDSLSGELGGIPHRLITRDEGHLMLRPATESEKRDLPGSVWTFLEVQKSMTFCGADANAEMARLVHSLVAEVAGEIKEHGCCYVPFLAWGASAPPWTKEWQRHLREMLPCKVPRPPLGRPGLQFP